MKSARIYAFGDSLTYGAWDSQGGWCDRIKRKLHEKMIDGEGGKFQMFNLGIGGEHSRGLLGRIKNEMDARYRPDWPAIIIIGTGANDTRYVEGGDPNVSLDEYKRNLLEILSIARTYTDKILFVGVGVVENEIQDFKGTLLSNELLRDHYKVMANVADDEGVPIVNVNSGLEASDKSVYFRDGVHLNEEGHKIVSELVWAKLEPILSS